MESVGEGGGAVHHFQVRMQSPPKTGVSEGEILVGTSRSSLLNNNLSMEIFPKWWPPPPFSPTPIPWPSHSGQSPYPLEEDEHDVAGQGGHVGRLGQSFSCGQLGDEGGDSTLSPWGHIPEKGTTVQLGPGEKAGRYTLNMEMRTRPGPPPVSVK